MLISRVYAPRPARVVGSAIRLALSIVLLSSIAAAANQYRIELVADQNLNIRGVETVLWVNESGDSSTEISMLCACNIERAFSQGKQLKVQKQRVLLPAAVAPGNTASIRVEFSAKAKRSYGYRMLTDAWHPKAVAFRNGRNSNQGQADSYEVTLIAPASLTVASSGRLMEKQAAEGNRQKWRWRLENVTSFGLAASSYFVETLRNSEGAEIRLYQLRGDSRFEAVMADYAVDVVRFYRQLFGFYPHPAVVMLPGNYKFGGGYSPASGFTVFHKVTGDYQRGYVAHEIGHQYWGFDTVLDDGDPCHWLGLGLGIYSDDLYMKTQKSSSVVGVWQYRQAAAKGLDTTLCQPAERMKASNFDWNGAICHAKSYSVIRMLADMMGPDRFLQFLRTLLVRYRYKYLSIKDFRLAAESAAERDLGWFFHDWVDTNATAEYEIESIRRKGDSVEVGIKRTGNARFPVSVRLTTTDGSQQLERINPMLEAQALSFTTQQEPKRIEIDPSGVCPLIKRGKELWEAK